MIDLGTVKPGTTLYIPFHTFDSNDPSASVTLTGLATTDIEIYKDGSTTQRASDSGYALLDTDGIDFDGITGIHGFSVNLADNTTAGFYASGSQYWIVVSSITVDAATVNFIAATFRIGYPDALLNTTIATLSTQTSFTLTAGPAEDDALNGCIVAIHDVASAVQMGFGVVSDYTGSTKTVTLTAGTTFTAAATDNIAFYPPVNVTHIGATAQTANDNGADINAILVDTAEIGAAGAGLTEAGGTGDHLTAINLPDQTMNITGDITGNLSGSVGSVTGAVGSVTGNVGGNVTGSVGSLAAQAKADVNAEVVDALNTDTYAEPGQGAPAATASIVTKIGFLFKAWRNRTTQTSSEYALYADDGTTKDQEAAISDNGTTLDRSEVTTGA